MYERNYKITTKKFNNTYKILNSAYQRDYNGWHADRIQKFNKNIS